MYLLVVVENNKRLTVQGITILKSVKLYLDIQTDRQTDEPCAIDESGT
jgi:hypothetical protein